MAAATDPGLADGRWIQAVVSGGAEQVFDVGQLRLRFSVSKQGVPGINVRFDPWTARFSGSGFEFAWSELMFRPDDCLARVYSTSAIHAGR